MEGTLTRLMTKGHSVWKGDLNVRRKSYLRRRKEKKIDIRIQVTFEKEQENCVSLFRIFETCGMTLKRNIDIKVQKKQKSTEKI